MLSDLLVTPRVLHTWLLIHVFMLFGNANCHWSYHTFHIKLHTSLLIIMNSWLFSATETDSTPTFVGFDVTNEVSLSRKDAYYRYCRWWPGFQFITSGVNCNCRCTSKAFVAINALQSGRFVASFPTSRGLCHSFHITLQHVFVCRSCPPCFRWPLLSSE